MNNMGKNIAIWLIVGLVLMTVFNQFTKRQDSAQQIAYSQFMVEVESNKISTVSMSES